VCRDGVPRGGGVVAVLLLQPVEQAAERQLVAPRRADGGEERGARLAGLLRHVEVLDEQPLDAAPPPPPAPPEHLRAGLQHEVVKNGVRARLLQGGGCCRRVVGLAVLDATGLGRRRRCELEGGGGEGVHEVAVRVRPQVEERLGLEGAVVLLVDAERAAWRRQPRARRSPAGRGGAAPLQHGGVISCNDD